MTKGKILIIEDETGMQEILQKTVQQLGFSFEAATNGRVGATMALEKPYDLLLVDVNLAGMSGFDVCRTVKAQHPHMPIILITSRGQEADRVFGLNIGADDYIVKPFSQKELLARMRALLRRTALSGASPAKVITFGDLVINPDLLQVTLRGERIELTVLEFDLLLQLARSPGKLFSREDLMRNLWGEETPDLAQSITTYFSRLRSKIESDPKKPVYIKTVYGQGYKLDIEGKGKEKK